MKKIITVSNSRVLEQECAEPSSTFLAQFFNLEEVNNQIDETHYKARFQKLPRQRNPKY